jgi:hypothetical protein
MNIQALAAQAGFIVDSDSQKYQPQCIQSTHSLIDEPLKKFAALVAAHEREECAKMFESIHKDSTVPSVHFSLFDTAYLIRTRSKE